MTQKEMAALADEMEALVRAEVDRRVGHITAQNEAYTAAFAETGEAIRGLLARVTALEAGSKANTERIEAVAKEPRVSILPQFVVPSVEAPAVHFAPTIQVPQHKPTKKAFTKQPDGSFLTEERE